MASAEEAGEPSASNPVSETTADDASGPSGFQFQRKHGLIVAAVLTVIMIIVGVAAGVSARSTSEEVALDVQAETDEETETEVIVAEVTSYDGTTAAAPTTARPTTSVPPTTTPATTTQATTTPPPPADRPPNCSVICVSVMNGAIPDDPIGLATHGAAWRIYPDFSADGLMVYCDCTNVTDGAWTVFQRRMDGSVDFYRNWANYSEGFGNVSGEFWLGLEALHNFTRDGDQFFKIHLEDWEGNRAYSTYKPLIVEGADEQYRIRVGHYKGYDGVTSDSLEIHNLNYFSTYDRPNGQIVEPTTNTCTKYYHGAWWYVSSPTCFSSHLNGKYYQEGETVPDPPLGVTWDTFKSRSYSLKSAEIKFRPL